MVTSSNPSSQLRRAPPVSQTWAKLRSAYSLLSLLSRLPRWLLNLDGRVQLVRLRPGDYISERLTMTSKKGAREKGLSEINLTTEPATEPCRLCPAAPTRRLLSTIAVAKVTSGFAYFLHMDSHQPPNQSVWNDVGTRVVPATTLGEWNAGDRAAVCPDLA